MKTKMKTMLIRIVALGLSGLLLSACSIEKQGNSTNRLDTPSLVGSWDLVAYERRDSTGNKAESYYGENPLGNLIYTASGDMSVQLVDPRVGSFASGDLLNATPEEIKEAYEGFFSYFGTYTIDLEAGTVTHHVIGASFRNYANSDMTRYFELSGDQLSLVTGVEMEGGVPSTFHLIWKRRAEIE
jgi:hypothetical protein